MLLSQLHEAASGTGTATAAQLLTGCCAQLTAVDWMLRQLHPSRQPKAAAAFAGSTGKPAVLLPWLQTVSLALVAAGSAMDPAGNQGECSVFTALHVRSCRA